MPLPPPVAIADMIRCFSLRRRWCHSYVTPMARRYANRCFFTPQGWYHAACAICMRCRAYALRYALSRGCRWWCCCCLRRVSRYTRYAVTRQEDTLLMLIAALIWDAVKRCAMRKDAAARSWCERLPRLFQVQQITTNQQQM